MSDPTNLMTYIRKESLKAPEPQTSHGQPASSRSQQLADKVDTFLTALAPEERAAQINALYESRSEYSRRKGWSYTTSRQATPQEAVEEQIKARTEAQILHDAKPGDTQLLYEYPLDFSIRNSEEQLMQVLLKHGARIDQSFSHSTPTTKGKRYVLGSSLHTGELPDTTMDGQPYLLKHAKTKHLLPAFLKASAAQGTPIALEADDLIDIAHAFPRDETLAAIIKTHPRHPQIEDATSQQSLLQICARNGHVESCRALLALPGAPRNGETAIEIADALCESQFSDRSLPYLAELVQQGRFEETGTRYMRSKLAERAKAEIAEIENRIGPQLDKLKILRSALSTSEGKWTNLTQGRYEHGQGMDL